MGLNIRKGLFILVATGTLIVNRGGLCAKANTAYFGDKVKATATVNIRSKASKESERLGSIKENKVAERILSIDDNWALVRYGDVIGYVSEEYIEYYGNDQDDIEHLVYEDLVFTTSKVNFRLEPNLEAKTIGSIPKDCELETIAYTANGWYLVRYNEKIGYIKADYAMSLTSYIKTYYPYINIKKAEIKKIVYAKTKLNIRAGNSTEYASLGMLEKYESVRVLEELDGWYLVLTNDNLIGFISKEYTKELSDVFVVIDISEQELCLYDGNELILKTDVTTGKNKTPTTKGFFKIYNKETDRYLVGEGYRSFVNYWMPFNGGIGLHDASWRSKFGGTIYKENGSHGCVNIPPEKAKEIYEKVSVGTKVLVHK